MFQTCCPLSNVDTPQPQAQCNPRNILSYLLPFISFFFQFLSFICFVIRWPWIQDIQLFPTLISTHHVKLSFCEQKSLACYMSLKKQHYKRKKQDSLEKNKNIALNKMFTSKLHCKFARGKSKYYTGQMNEPNKMKAKYRIFHMCYQEKRTRDSSVDTATRYGLDGPGIVSRWGRNVPHPSRPHLRPTQPPIRVQWVPAISRG